jgi:hypothetical protein
VTEAIVWLVSERRSKAAEPPLLRSMSHRSVAEPFGQKFQH